ncbi:hypothetical protein [Stieleria mannarensis]|uniref:hypothetical protein n=1 Tax=Stieleria mannarensis TaxID=2755585 RepID=UPI0016012D19|nr:hypothetical protein [Rhodopirellula sp. JC639]
MQLCFVYTSNPLNDRNQIDAVLAAFPIECRRQQIADVGPQIDVNHAGELTVEIEVDLNATNATSESTRIATAAVGVVAELATQFKLTWNVGHQHEPYLGTVEAAVPPDDLLDEVKTAVSVARSLAEFSLEDEADEFAEPETLVTDAADTDQATWDDLFQPPDTFIRFPEFEEE